MRIMQELLKQKTLVNVNAYLNYTADIFRLASKYIWFLVLLYDKEYRDMQANEKFVYRCRKRFGDLDHCSPSQQ
jgi:hypothetical protein